MQDIRIPYGAYWSTPFARWQGSLAHLHALKFGAQVGVEALRRRNIPTDALDFGVLGTTVPQEASFYGLPWVAAMMGAGHLAGPTISQACATGARVLATAAHEIGNGDASAALVLTADRVSNGPHLYYPAPDGPGGTGIAENWVWDNFQRDPVTNEAMLKTAENVADKWQISTAEQNDVTLRRYQQYKDAQADGSAFLRRYMELPLPVPDARGRVKHSMTGDEGIQETTAEGLAKLKPVLPGGTVTFGGQTHPADGSAGLIVTNADKAREMSAEPGIAISVIAFGQGREAPAFMPAAPIKAARRALDAAGLSIRDMAVIKSHNPFIVNDIVFCRETGADVMAMNNYGSSIVWGHPQGPTGLRLIIETIEELAMKGGGYGLFQGCAAGDTAMAVIVKVTDERKG